MPKFIDRERVDKTSDKTTLIKTRLEAADHERKVEEAVREHLGEILNKIAISNIRTGEVIKVIISLVDPGFVFEGPKSKKMGAGFTDGEDDEGKEESIKVGSGGDEAAPPYTYEKEVKLEKIVSHLFDKVRLPSDIRKKIRKKQEYLRQRGLKRKGPRTRLNRRSTFFEKRKREVALRKKLDYELRDQRYWGLKERAEHGVKGVVFFIRDKSGSMTTQKVELMKGLLILVYWFLRLKYSEVEIVYILHDTQAEKVSEKEFFSIESAGGTYLSSGIEKALSYLRKDFPPAKWNIYIFQFTDGENSDNDIAAYKKAIKEALFKVSFFGYVEVQPNLVTEENNRPGAQIPLMPVNQAESTVFKEVQDFAKTNPNFSAIVISLWSDIGKAFLKLLKSTERRGYGRPHA